MADAAGPRSSASAEETLHEPPASLPHLASPISCEHAADEMAGRALIKETQSHGTATRLIEAHTTAEIMAEPTNVAEAHLHANEVPVKHPQGINAELDEHEIPSKHAKGMPELVHESPSPSAEAQALIKPSEISPSMTVEGTGEMRELDKSHTQLSAIPLRTEAPIKHSRGPLLDCVVKLFCTRTQPNFSQPWQMKHPSIGYSSGFVISGHRLLTTAHSVQYHTQVKVKRRNSDTRYLATVLASGRECDLALLTVNNEEFWDGLVTFVEFGDLPNLQDAVTVVGYPRGGDSMSVTRGVVSRVEVTSYIAGARLLGVQIDAAINSGNSGGPVFNDNAQCVGVAFQKLSKGDNIGYIIPTPVITHFITDYELHGEYKGFPSLGISQQKLQNPSLRKAFGMAPHLKGILIKKVAPTSSAAKFLQPSDILLSLDGVTIGNDGTVPFRNGERIHYKYLVSAKYTGEQARIEILRGSVKQSFDIKLQCRKKLIAEYTDPSYYIIGGIVFTIVSEPYLLAEFGKNFRHVAPPSLMDQYAHSMAQTKDQELVIISQILVAEINIDYEECSNRQLISFNGTLINNLKQLVGLVEACEETFLRFELEHNQMVVLNTKEAKRATPKILRTHRIPSPMSQDLLQSPESSQETQAS